MSLTTADLVVLSLLAEGPAHGYGIVAELERRQVKDWAGVSRPQVYYSLKKLARSRQIRGAEGSDAHGPERQTFAITPAGRVALQRALADERWTHQRTPAPFLSWLALSWVLTKEQRLEMLEARREFLLGAVEKETADLKGIREELGEGSIPQLMVEWTLEQFGAELCWLQRVKQCWKAQG
jgi:DNA-binding PadR family transcriptional regulator